MATPTVCVCVPVWQGAAFVAETLSSILSQRDVELIVKISVDGADAESAEVCSKFLSDERCELTVQPERLGWVSNISWLLERAEGDYVCIQPHDDLIAEDYLSSLLGVAEATPAASVVYSDIDVFGEYEGKVTQPSVIGSPLTRQLVLLLDHWAAVAFRGLTRLTAARDVGPLRGSSFRDFGADTVWMAQLAKAGELHRVRLPLYRKRVYSGSTHRAWSRWSRVEKLSAWGQHCADMLAEALALEHLDASRRIMLARAALARTMAPMAFPGDAPFSVSERRRMALTFLHAAKEDPISRLDNILGEFGDLVVDDIVSGRSYPSEHRELTRAVQRLRAIESSTTWRVARTCSKAVTRVPFITTVARKLFGKP
jgi:glycosyltransferase involved in cell wall biosynthesis